MSKHTTFSVHQFTNMDTLPFNAADYSALKFGSDRIARQYGRSLANEFFSAHADTLLGNRCVVIPSPYNFVPNAASIMAQYFYHHLNWLLVDANGEHLEWSLIHRKVSYTADYGFLSKERRKGLIDNDQFYLNKGFLKGKTLLFVDDIRITGTHEDKLKEVLENSRSPNTAFFLYFAQYQYTNGNADIEATLNFSGIKNLADYQKLASEPNHHLIIRPIKLMLSSPFEHFEKLLATADHQWIERLHQSCLAEGYYKIPAYQENFQALIHRL